MARTDPASLEEYNLKSTMNTYITASGVSNLVMHHPCPFCAEADFKVIKFMDYWRQRSPRIIEGTCEGCGRSGRIVVTTVRSIVDMKLTQTGGESLPNWFEKVPAKCVVDMEKM